MDDKFEIDKLNIDYLSELSGIEITGYQASRLGLWCEDAQEAMAYFDPGDSVSMAKKLSSLCSSLGVLWPADGDAGIASAHAAVAVGLAESKGFDLSGKEFQQSFTAAMADAGAPNGHKLVYKAIAENIQGDGVARDGYGRQLHENGRPESMWYLSPGRYVNEMVLDNARIRSELYEEDPLRPSVQAETQAGTQAEMPSVSKEAVPQKQGAWEKLKGLLSGSRGGVERGLDGPEL